MKSMKETWRLNNGVQIPCLGFGTYKAAEGSTSEIIKTAIRCGYRYLDTASFYETETYVGEAVAESGIRREEFFLVSKVWKDEMGYDGTLRAFERTLENLGTDYLENKKEYDALAEKVVYTGTIDSYFGYRFGRLQYRSLRFETEVLDTDNFQGNAVINYTDRETPYTRIIEHKHFEFGTQEKTVITKEYPAEWTEGMEPYYPVNDEKNQELYKRYEALAAEEKNVIFGGRLAEYRYYDMDKVIESAFACVKKEFHGINIAADHR